MRHPTGRCRALRALGAAIALIASATTAAPATGHRVVSISTCADQLLLEIADPVQITALSPLADDPWSNADPERAAAWPMVADSAEAVLARRPTLVLASPFGQQHTIALLRQQGVAVIELAIANSFADFYANVRQIGEQLGREDAAEDLIARMRARLEALPPVTEPRPLMAIFDASGYTSGRATLRGEMLTLSGFDNLATRLGIEHFGQIALESLLRHRPQALLDTPYKPGAWSHAQALPDHPALTRGSLAPQRVAIPIATTLCAGPWTIDSIEVLSAARLALQAVAQ